MTSFTQNANTVNLGKMGGGGNFRRPAISPAANLAVTFLVAAAILQIALFTGCDSTTAVVKDKYRKLDKYLKDATVLERANDQLAKAKDSRKKLAEMAQKFRIDAEVAQRQVKRLEEELQKSKAAFASVQDAAKQSGLPKFAEATAEQKAVKIQIAGKEMAGSEVYNLLKKFKGEVVRCEQMVNREKTKSSHLSTNAERIESGLSRADDNITAIENQIEDYKMYQEMLSANKTVADLGLDDAKIDTLLNSDSIIAELRKKVDESEIANEVKDKETRSDEVKETINSGSSGNSITGDDLI